MSRVGLIVLAAGASTRLGSPKQLLSLQGQTLIRRAVETALASVCRPVIVVLGANATPIKAELAALPVQIVENTRWQEGMASSLDTGLAALLQAAEPESESEAVVFMLCDQPLLSPEILNRLVATYQERKCPVVASEYGDAPGVPALFARLLFPELRALRGKEGAKSILRRYHTQVVALPFPEGAQDVDSPEDFASICAALAQIPARA